jgi:hypothetical protein
VNVLSRNRTITRLIVFIPIHTYRLLTDDWCKLKLAIARLLSQNFPRMELSSISETRQHGNRGKKKTTTHS